MFQTKERLSFYDCDPAGIIFYASLLKLAHTAYEKFLSNISPGRNFFFDSEMVLPIIHCEANYYKPLKAFDEIDIKIVVNELRKNSFELNYSFEKNGSLFADAQTIHVCVNKIEFKKVNLPEKLKTGLNQHLLK